LPFADAIYRGDGYTTETSLFSPPVALEAALPQVIVRTLKLPLPPNSDTRIYAPLALGGHVDHRLAREAGLLLARAGWTVWFYEDLPYALQAEDATSANDDNGWEPRLVDGSASWREKIAAVMAYPSQNPIIFRHVAPDGDDRGIERAMARYAEQVGGAKRKAERYWRPSSE
jgi:hypothetical protein